MTIANIFCSVCADWGLDVFTYSYHWWVVPILATHVGAILGAWIYYLAIGNINYFILRNKMNNYCLEINFPPSETVEHVNGMDMSSLRVSEENVLDV